ncbi:octopamine receptor 1-like [Patiria miniata]|uniref:G-protein coupled receptors family 1 profile domain-containing protein n=1 Tax=Patiria miniata TaxID=46514 RepID=A0A913ZV75_PATMI|nr:octopamine receptor 1-like [Patiria miniata]
MCSNMYGNLTCYDDLAARYIQAFFSSTNTVLIICGNTLALVVVYRTKALQDAAFCFLMNLALSDLLLGVISQPPSLYYAITCHWPGGEDGFYCQFVGFCICLLCSVSIISLGLVSYERYHYTVHPFRHIAKFTFRRSFYACVIVWLYSAVASVFPVVGLWNGVGLQPYNALCNIQWEEEPIYMWAMVSGVLFPSWALIVFSYFRILKVARKARKIDAIRHQITLGASVSNIDRNIPTCSAGVVIDNDDSTISTIRLGASTRSRKHRPTLKKTMKSNKCTLTVSLLVGTFIVCWTPYVIVNVIQAIRCTPNPFAATAFAQWMCIFNSACNPLIYGLTNKTFREGVGKLMQRFRCWSQV